jgi:hypothetical protein
MELGVWEICMYNRVRYYIILVYKFIFSYLVKYRRSINSRCVLRVLIYKSKWACQKCWAFAGRKYIMSLYFCVRVYVIFFIVFVVVVDRTGCI